MGYNPEEPLIVDPTEGELYRLTYTRHIPKMTVMKSEHVEIIAILILAKSGNIRFKIITTSDNKMWRIGNELELENNKNIYKTVRLKIELL